MAEPWTTLLTFVLAVLLLNWLQRWITQHMQGIGFLLFESRDAGMFILWCVLLPGILVHEFSHWLLAKLLGLKTGRFKFWPEFQKGQITLASIEVQRSNAVADSLVGLAPFLGGTLILLLIGYWVFDANALGLAWQNQDWRGVLGLLAGTVRVADSWFWLYLMVAVSNAMMPSPSDRASWRPVLLYLGLVAALLLLLGWWPTLPTALLTGLEVGLQTLIYALGLTLAVDAVFALAIAIVELLLGLIRGTRVVYK